MSAQKGPWCCHKVFFIFCLAYPVEGMKALPLVVEALAAQQVSRFSVQPVISLTTIFYCPKVLFPTGCILINKICNFIYSWSNRLYPGPQDRNCQYVLCTTGFIPDKQINNCISFCQTGYTLLTRLVIVSFLCPTGYILDYKISNCLFFLSNRSYP